MAEKPTSICVFCGAKPGNSPQFLRDAELFGSAMGAAGWRLIFGAGDSGIMGTVAQAVENNGGTTLGVIPTHLMPREQSGQSKRPTVITETMHERKKVMIMNADALVLLPGGVGSLEEFFEVLTWRQIGLLTKPIVLLNTDGYWDKLTQLLDHTIAQGFADASLRDYYCVAQTVDDAMAALRARLS